MLLCLTADYRSTPIPVLEQLERRAGEIARALAGHEGARGSVVLATCNRFEAYLELAGGAAGPGAGAGQGRASDPGPASASGSQAAAIPGRDDGSAAILAEVARAAGIGAEALAAAAGISSDEVAAEHLFAVACGLESAAIGEGEIAGQVRRAHAGARADGSVSDLLERLFQRAHRVQREVKHRTALQGEGRSLVRLALLLAERRIPAWGEAGVLLVGTGAYAGATVAALRDRGAERIAVHSPSGRAAAFAGARGLAAVPEGGLRTALASADLVVACSGAQEPVITSADLRGAPARPRLLLDLGMPRNIDPAAAGAVGAELLDIDAIAKHAPVPELSAAAEARRMVREAAREFSASRAEREAIPILVGLRGHVLGILEEELCRARGGAAEAGAAGDGMGDPAGDAEQRIERALRRFTGRLLHEPSARIRALGREGRAEEARAAAEALFGIDPV